MPDDRPNPRPHADDRGRPPGPGGRPPFRPAPRPDSFQPLVHTLRLRDGDREIEVSGSAAFIRQVLDDIPELWARLRGEVPAQPSRIRMPPPPVEPALAGVAEEA